MKHLRKSLAIVLALGSIGSAVAAVTAEEAKQLGTTLTAIGAEKAASKDGSIPEFTNAPITPPADYKPGSGHYTDPYKSEKPLLSIDAKNMDQYADKLSEGTKTLLKRWPTYRIDVYPTHRTGTYSKWIGDNTLKNAANAKLVDNGLGVEGTYGGPPFPIPKSGQEVIWNIFLQPTAFSTDSTKMAYMVDANSRVTPFSVSTMYHEYPYYDPDRTSIDGLAYHKFLTGTIEPARDVGNKTLGWYSINYGKQDFLVWIYSTGQRRVRLAPETKYDSLAGPQGYVFDEFNLYSGSPDRYDFKLVGKKDIYIPYNTYRAAFGAAETAITPQHFNPDALRWELHRVWVVDGTLKPGLKHAMSRRTFYVDEDTWAIALADSYDSTGKLVRTAQDLAFQMYDGGIQSFYNSTNIFYNIFKDGYLVMDYFGSDPKMFAKPVPKRPPEDTSSDSMGGSGIR